jgi:DNA-binding CsgD family transcriptional regulator
MEKFSMRVTGYPLVGRDAELFELRKMLRALEGGTGNCTIVEGPAGIGKSRLIAAAIQEANKFDIDVITAQATELDKAASLMMSLQSHGFAPRNIKRGGNDDRFRLLNRLSELIDAHTWTRPLLIVLDDAQWVDEFTVLALRTLIPTSLSSPVAWLLGRRTMSARTPATDPIELLIDEGARRLFLGPLPDRAMAALCASMLDAEPDATVLGLATRSGGNPFLLEQLLTALRQVGQVVVEKGVATATSLELPTGFLDPVNHRLRTLSTDARRLLDVASVLGRPFTLHEAAALIGRPAVGLVPAADEAVEECILVERDHELAFHHDLIREAVYNGLTRPVRTVLHREAARVVQAEKRSPLEAAEHLIRSGHKGDARAIGVLREAATQAAPHAPATAADFIMAMLDMIDDHDEERPLLVADAVRLLASAGRVDEARRIGELTFEAGLNAKEEAALLLGLSEALKHAGQNAAVVDYTRRGLRLPGVPDETQAHLLAIQAHGLLYTDDIDHADNVAAQAIKMGNVTNEKSAVVFGAVARSVAARASGRVDEAIQHAEDAVRTADRERGEARHRHPQLWLGRALAAADRFDDAAAIYSTGQREADRIGTAWSKPLWHHYRAELLIGAGRLQDAKAEAETGVRVTEQLNARQLGVALRGLLSRVAIRSGDIDEAGALLDQAESLLSDRISVGPIDLAWPMALFREATSDPEDVTAGLAHVYSRVSALYLLLTVDPAAASALVRIALRAGDRAKARAAAGAACRLAQLNPVVASYAGAAAHADGLLNGDVDRLRQAVHNYRSGPRPLALASAMEDLARAEHKANRDHAVTMLEESLRLYSRSGAERDAGRVRERMRSLGLWHGVTREPTEPPTSWDSLTESELRVVKLVVEGLTNREVASRLYLSPHTVDSHLRHVFTKLDVNSRVELTRQFTARERAAEM